MIRFLYTCCDNYLYLIRRSIYREGVSWKLILYLYFLYYFHSSFYPFKSSLFKILRTITGCRQYIYHF